ncbi:MAG: uridine kinase [Rhodothermales bacterium]
MADVARPLVIGIAGGSGSGKTTLVKRIYRAFGADNIALLEHDAYYHAQDHLPLGDRQTVNYDHPHSLDTALLCTHVDVLLAGGAIQRPVYDFVNHTRSAETLEVPPKPVLILDGILVLAEPSLVERMDIKLFVDTPDDIRLLRRIRRDTTERGRPLTSVLDQYERTVRPMHLEFVEPSKRLADLIIPRGGHNAVAVRMVMAHIAAQVADARSTSA